MKIAHFAPICRSGELHIPTVKQKRKYVDDKETLVCKCTKGWQHRLDVEISGKTVGDVCWRCESEYKYAKEWHLYCPVCKEVA